MTDAEVIELIREIARLRNKINTQSKLIDYLKIKIKVLKHQR